MAEYEILEYYASVLYLGESLRNYPRLIFPLLFATLLLGATASAASFTVILDKKSYNYGDLITIRIEGTLPCNIATLKIISPGKEDVKVLLVTQNELREGVKVRIPSFPVDGWIAGTYQVDVVCGHERASATFELKARPPPPPKPRLPVIHVVVLEAESGRPIPKAVVVAYTVDGKVIGVEETNYEGKAALSVGKTTVIVVARASGYYISERTVNVNEFNELDINVTLRLERVKRIDVLEQRLDQITVKLNTLSSRLEETSGKITLLNTRLTALTGQLQTLTMRLNNIEQVIKDLECRVRALEEAVKSLIDKVFGG